MAIPDSISDIKPCTMEHTVKKRQHAEEEKFALENKAAWSWQIEIKTKLKIQF